VSGYEIVTASGHSNNLGIGEMLSARALCPTGKRPLSGGVQSVNPQRYPTIGSSYPDPTLPMWVGEIRNTTAAAVGSTDIVVYAICARVQ